MEDFSINSFCFGSLYGFVAAGGVAMLLGQMREARGRMASKNRALNNFPASVQPNLTAANIVQNSRQATWTYYILTIGLVVFIGLMAAVAFFIF